MKTIEIIGTLTAVGQNSVTISLGGECRGMARSFDVPATQDEQREWSPALHVLGAVRVRVDLATAPEGPADSGGKIRLDMGDIYINGPAHRTEKLVEFIAKTIAAALNVKPPTGAA